jgi:aromatic-L-amino-acid/L-tryptophan decarboxylase
MEFQGEREPIADFSWSAHEIRRVGHRVVDLIADYLTRLPDGPVFRPVPADLGDAWMSSSLPEEGEPVDEILNRFAEKIAPYPFGNGHPRFYAWVNSPPARIGVMAEALAAAMNPSVAGGNHAAVWIERQVLEWFKQLVGFPSDAMGLLVSGGSMAAVTALAAARYEACARHDWDVRKDGIQRSEPRSSSRRLLVYKGAEGHGCHQKAVELLGIGSANIRLVPSDRILRLRVDALDEMIREDIAAGHIPVAVIASAGTVNTGAIDSLDRIADVCSSHRVWLHVDAAYGGAAIMTRHYKDSFSGLSRADSLVLDPHKWMYVPVDAGVVLVKREATLRNAFSLVPPYLRTDGNLRGVQGPTWFSEYGPEQTRPFRALKVWAALRYFGREGYRALLDHDIGLARHLADRVRTTPGYELWEPVSLSIVCFRATPSRLPDGIADHDALNREILEDLQLGGEGFLSGTTLHGRFWLRACIVNPCASKSDIDVVFDAVHAAFRKRARG